MSETLNTSIVVSNRGIFKRYEVFATLWATDEFEPLIENKQWALTSRKANSIARKYVMAFDAVIQLKELIDANH